jgi:hypothetical protein
MAKAITEVKGMPGMRIIEMDHPLGGLTEDELGQRFDQVIAQVITHLESAATVSPSR